MRLKKLALLVAMGILLLASGTMAQLRGTTPLPNPLGGPPDGKSFGTPGTFGGGE